MIPLLPRNVCIPPATLGAAVVAIAAGAVLAVVWGSCDERAVHTFYSSNGWPAASTAFLACTFLLWLAFASNAKQFLSSFVQMGPLAFNPLGGLFQRR